MTLGAFRLPSDLVRQIDKFEPMQRHEAASTPCRRTSANGCGVNNGRFYRGANPGEAARSATSRSSPAGAADGGERADAAGRRLIRPYRTKSGDAINRLQLGSVAAADMFRAAVAENTMWTWILRLVGFALMSAGIGLVLRPLGVFGDVIPFIGDVIRFGTGFAAVGIGLVLSLVTIALGWITYRPMVGLVVLAGAGLVLFGVLRLARDRRRAGPGERQPSLGTT